MFQRILVPLDGSARAERAVPLAARVARYTGGSVLLLRVLTHPLDAVAAFLRPPQESEQAAEAAHAQAISYLQQISCCDALCGLGTSLQVADSSPAQTILSAVRLQQVDSIVMCRHSGTHVSRWALGSVAQTIARHSPVPVFLLSEREENGALDLLHPVDAHPIRVVVPLDGSAFAEAALLPAAHLSAALSAPAPGSLHLVTVLPVRDDGKPHPNLDTEASQREVEGYLQRIERQMRRGARAQLRLEASSSVISGNDVAEALIRLAEDEPSGEKHALENRDAVMAMATHGRHGTDLWLTGSVTERVLQASHLPLLVVRPPQQ